MGNGGPRHHYLFDNAIPLAIIAAGLLGQAQAPLEHRSYALGGILICAIAARIALYMWRRSGVEHFTDTLKRK